MWGQGCRHWVGQMRRVPGVPHRKPCVREDSWREKEAASERRRRKRGRPAFEAATSVWHTSQSVCAPNQESHWERLEGRRYGSHEAQWPRTRRRPGSWCWDSESTNTLLKSITLTRKQGQSALHVLSRSRGLRGISQAWMVRLGLLRRPG